MSRQEIDPTGPVAVSAGAGAPGGVGSVPGAAGSLAPGAAGSLPGGAGSDPGGEGSWAPAYRSAPVSANVAQTARSNDFGAQLPILRMLTSSRIEAKFPFGSHYLGTLGTSFCDYITRFFSKSTNLRCITYTALLQTLLGRRRASRRPFRRCRR